MDSSLETLQTWRKNRNYYRNLMFSAKNSCEVPMTEVVTGDAMYLAGYASRQKRPYIYISPKCSAYKTQITDSFREWIGEEQDQMDKVKEIESHYCYEIPWSNYQSQAGALKRLDLTNITKVVEDAIFESFDHVLDDKLVVLKTERKMGCDGDSMKISVLFEFYKDWQSHD